MHIFMYIHACKLIYLYTQREGERGRNDLLNNATLFMLSNKWRLLKWAKSAITCI